MFVLNTDTLSRLMLIVAIALAHRATVVTRNVRHFREVPGLQVENWVD